MAEHKWETRVITLAYLKGAMTLFTGWGLSNLLVFLAFSRFSSSVPAPIFFGWLPHWRIDVVEEVVHLVAHLAANLGPACSTVLASAFGWISLSFTLRPDSWSRKLIISPDASGSHKANCFIEHSPWRKQMKSPLNPSKIKQEIS